MAQKIIMPKQGLQMTEGHMIQWHKMQGDYVKLGEPLFEIETDKLSIVIDSTAEGTLLKIIHPEGDIVPVAEVVAYIGQEGELIEEKLSPPKPTPAITKLKEPVVRAIGNLHDSLEDSSTELFATPRAKLRAEQRHVDLGLVPASGPEGLVIERDVLAFNKKSASPLAEKLAQQNSVDLKSLPGTGLRGKVMAQDVRGALSCLKDSSTREALETVMPMDGMRSGIARQMRSSLDTSAQANHSMLVDMSECLRLKEQLKATQIKVSINDIVIRCTARALSEFPQINASRVENTIVQKHYVNVGVAIATDKGLLVPVIHHADKKTLPQIAAVTVELADKTRKGSLSPDDLVGGTFTVTNLGMLGVDRFTAIINPPESGILAVGAVKKQAVVLPDDSIAARPMMWLTLTYDHCVTDGAPSARFLGRIKELLETPALLL